MIRFHCGFKRVKNGYVPVVRIRGPRGQMAGSKVNKAITYSSPGTAESEAYICAYRAAKVCADRNVLAEVVV